MQRKLFSCMLLFLFAVILPASFALAEANEADFAITLTADTAELTAGQQAVLTVEFANPEAVNKDAKNDQIIWTVTDTSGEKSTAATVKQGIVTAQKNITEITEVIVTAEAKSMPGQTASVKLVITPLVSKVTVTADTDILYLEEGYNTTRLTAVTEPEDAADAISWKSSNEKIATVDENGVVTAVSIGKATVTATANDGSKRSGKINITVGIPVGDLQSIQWSGSQYLNAGKDSATFSVKEFFDKEGNKINPTNKRISWSIKVEPESAQDLVSIDEKGKLTTTAECPAAMVTVTGSAEGSLPPDSATISTEVFITPSTVPEESVADSIDDFYGTWVVFMGADKGGKTLKGDKILSMMGKGLWSLYFEVLEYDGSPAVFIYANYNIQRKGYNVHVQDGKLYSGLENSDEGVVLLELCSNGTAKESIISVNQGETAVYCFRTSNEKRVVVSQNQTSEQGQDNTSEQGIEIPESVCAKIGGMPDTIDELSNIYDLDLMRTLFEQIRPAEIAEALRKNGECSFPASGIEWESAFIYTAMDEQDPQEIISSIQYADDLVTVKLSEPISTDAPIYSMTIYARMYDDVQYSLHCYTNKSHNHTEAEVESYKSVYENGFTYSETVSYVGKSASNKYTISITIYNETAGKYLGNWFAAYDQNGKRQHKHWNSWD